MTYVVRSGPYEYVVRRRPVGKVPRGAHDMAREHRVLAALRGGTVPVPTVFGYCDDETIVGAPFYVMSLVHGVVFHRRDDVATLTPVQAGRSQRQSSMSSIGFTGSIRRGSGSASSGDRRGSSPAASDAGSSSGAVGRTGTSRSSTSSARSSPQPCRRTPMRRRPRGLPAGEHARRHGEPVRIAAVLDWELSTLGDPLTDLAHLLVYWEPTRGRVTHESQDIAGHPAS